MNPRRFSKISRIEDEATGKVLERIRFPKLGSKIGEIDLLPSTIYDRRNFERALRDVGARLPTARAKIRLLLDQLANEKAAVAYIYAARCGWAGDQRTFVLPDCSIGRLRKTVIGVNPALLRLDKCGTRAEAGTWKRWRDEVAKPAAQSSLLMCTISFALAAPLMSLLHRESRTLCLLPPWTKPQRQTAATLVRGLRRRHWSGRRFAHLERHRRQA